MPKKRTPRQRLAAQQRARLQRRELARQEEFREQHTRKVLERQGDPRFVQRTRHPDGTATVTWDSESDLGQEMSRPSARRSVRSSAETRDPKNRCSSTRTRTSPPRWASGTGTRA